MRGRKRLWLALALALSLLAAASPPLTAGAETPPQDIALNRGVPAVAWFSETNHNVSGDILHNWLSKESFLVYGYPISEPVIENGRTVQYFERARLEHWPEYAGGEWVVQGTLLGRWKATRLQNVPAFKPVQKPANIDPTVAYYFDETQHTLANGFKKFWDEHGGVHVFGFPISEEFTENGFVVQYFERARFEHHPENAGTPYEILLGHLGREYAEAKRVDQKPGERTAEAVNYDPGIFDVDWTRAMSGGEQARWAYTAVGSLPVQAEPRFSADVIDTVYYGRPVVVNGLSRGEVDDKGSDAWYRLQSGGYVPATTLDPLVAPAPPQTFSGRWVDVNLTHFWAIAYDGNTPVYVATIVAGKNDQTPKGVFQVFSRVRSEIMNSETLGTPRDAPGGYYLENVEFTQYFLDGGFAIHGNYWVAEWNFGAYASAGCVGMMNPDAEFFWNWLGYGSYVSIHF
jgi:lipoprotein-anchoring transpeptidase ErfK/SrfK